MTGGRRVRALALVSSGLDSMLAAKLVRDQGIDVTGIHCMFRFDPAGQEDPQSRFDRLFGPLDIPVQIHDVTDAFLRMVLDPPHGYGKGLNPCIDCKIFMLRHARDLLASLDARFVVTGEVAGQRPMSQMKPTLFHIEKESGIRGLIVRPLSARCLPPSIPEKRGWVDRNRLFGISGRSRKIQIEIAESLGIRLYNQPAGGCILTDLNYASRAKRLFRERERSAITPEDMRLLRPGRHFWTDRGVHVVVGRDEADNGVLEGFRTGRWVFEAVDFTGPLVLAENVRDAADIETVAAITARYCGRNKADRFRIRFAGPRESGEVTAVPVDDAVLNGWMVSS
ncbi:MAG TPA: hypothetical protein ENN17_04660 [bacterium]|nr:hypothetical protein [bacterium]